MFQCQIKRRWNNANILHIKFRLIILLYVINNISIFHNNDINSNCI